MSIPLSTKNLIMSKLPFSRAINNEFFSYAESYKNYKFHHMLIINILIQKHMLTLQLISVPYLRSSSATSIRSHSIARLKACILQNNDISFIIIIYNTRAMNGVNYRIIKKCTLRYNHLCYFGLSFLYCKMQCPFSSFNTVGRF